MLEEHGITITNDNNLHEDALKFQVQHEKRGMQFSNLLFFLQKHPIILCRYLYEMFPAKIYKVR